MERARLGRFASLLLVVLALAGIGCATPPDPDAVLPGARELRFGGWRADSLWCERSRWRWWAKEDCADWYRIRSDRPERIDVSVAMIERVEGDGSLTLTLADGQGRVLDTVRRDADGSLAVAWRPRDGQYYLAVRPTERFRSNVRYEIRARQEDPPPPPAPPPRPRFRKERSMILEIERAPSGERTVLIDMGRSRGAEVGQRGHLVDDGDAVADVEVVEVFNDGSRVRVDQDLIGRITPTTEVEIDVRLDAN